MPGISCIVAGSLAGPSALQQPLGCLDFSKVGDDNSSAC